MVPILGAVTVLAFWVTADALNDTASKIGMSIEALQEWNHCGNNWN